MAGFSKLKQLFPHASKSFISENSDTDAELQDPESKRTEGKALGCILSGKEKGYERAHLIITAFTVRPHDQDNLTGGCKALIDCIKKLNLIPDDDPYSIELTVKQRHVDKFEQEKTLVQIKYI